MALDSYVTVGRTGLRVSPLCLGAMTFGTPQLGAVDEATSHRIMDTFFDAGGNFIDTANGYGAGAIIYQQGGTTINGVEPPAM